MSNLKNIMLIIPMMNNSNLHKYNMKIFHNITDKPVSFSLNIDKESLLLEMDLEL